MQSKLEEALCCLSKAVLAAWYCSMAGGDSLDGAVQFCPTLDFTMVDLIVLDFRAKGRN